MTNQTGTAVVERKISPIAEARLQLHDMQDQFKAALPAHIPVERFARVVMTALQNNQKLLTNCTRSSLWSACMKSAQDGLLPDGREAAIVEYGQVATYMPMIAGIRKKVRNSGDIATWDCYVVHQNDRFAFRLGDDPFIAHEPTLDNPGNVIAAYSIAVLKSGEKSREVMSITAIEKVRQRSKAKNNGPWVTDYEEMCRKTVARRHSKVLPMSTDLDDLIRRDDELYDMEGSKDESAKHPERSLAGKLDALASVADRAPAATTIAAGAAVNATTSDDQGSSALDDLAAGSANTADTAESTPKGSAGGGAHHPAPEDGANEAAAGGTRTTAAANGPTNEESYIRHCRGWITKLPRDVVEQRWTEEKALRHRLLVSADVRDMLLGEVKRKASGS